MATELWLGPSGSEVLLPPVNWIGEPGEYPESFKKNYDSATMLDGRIRYNFKASSQRSWTLAWAMLTRVQLNILIGLADSHRTLLFRNGLTVNPLWATVTVTSFSYAPLMSTFHAAGLRQYRVALTLEEEGS